MNRLTLILFTIIVATVLLVPQVSYSATRQEIVNKINVPFSSAVANATDSVVNGNWSSIDKYLVGYKTNTSELDDFVITQYSNDSWVPIMLNGTIVVNSTTTVPPPIINDTEPPSPNDNQTTPNDNQTNPNPTDNQTNPEPKIEVCGDGIDNNDNGLADEGCPITPPEQPDEPEKNFNSSETIRLAVVGDIDDNNGLTTQIKLAQEYHADCFVVAGDYGYKNGQAVINEIKDADFNCTVVDAGNHDDHDCDLAKVGHVEYKAPLVSFFLIDADNCGNKFDSGSAQFAQLKDQLGSSDSYYNIPVVHQPFVTVSSTHGGNGQFKTYDPLFRANGVENVIQAHNHNYQRIDVNGIIYGTYGTGTHDIGSSMYPLKSNDWQGHECQKCITGTNGITIMDLKIDDPHIRQVSGYFISNSGDVKDKWVN